MSEKVAIYCRLSKEDKDKTKAGDDSESIQNQKILLMEYADYQNWDIYNIYFDDDYSGLDSERPQFKQMIKDAEKGLFDIILCKTQSRFTRDMELVEKYIHGRFPVLGIRFVSIVDNVDTNVKGNKKARQIYALTNEWYCEDVSDNIKAVFRIKMREGLYLGSFAAYGYIKDPTNKHRLIIDKEAADVVREIYELYLKGYGCKQIADILTERKVLPPSSYKHSQGLKYESPSYKKFSHTYGTWASNTVSRILANQVYLGTLVQGRQKKISYKSKKVVITPEEEWIIVKNAHEPIIDKDIYDKVQVLRSNRRTTYKLDYKSSSAKAQSHVLAGKLKCLDCGGNLNRSAKGRNGDIYLKCQLSTKTKKAACTYHTIKQHEIEKIIENRIRQIIEQFILEHEDMNFENEFCVQGDSIRNEIALLEQESKTLVHKVDELNRMLTAAYKDKVRGNISENEFFTIKTIFNTDSEEYKKRQEIVEKKIDMLNYELINLKDVGKVLKDCINFDMLTHEMVSNFIDYIEIGEKNDLGEQVVNIHWLF